MGLIGGGFLKTRAYSSYPPRRISYYSTAVTLRIQSLSGIYVNLF